MGCWPSDLPHCIHLRIRAFFYFRKIKSGWCLKKHKSFFSCLCSDTCSSVPLVCSTTCFLMKVDESLCCSVSLLQTWQAPGTVTVLRSLISPLLQSALLSCSLQAVALVCGELLCYASCSWQLNSKKELCLLPACSPVYPISTNDLAVQKIKLLLEILVRSAGITFVQCVVWRFLLKTSCICFPPEGHIISFLWARNWSTVKFCINWWQRAVQPTD